MRSTNICVISNYITKTYYALETKYVYKTDDVSSMHFVSFNKNLCNWLSRGIFVGVFDKRLVTLLLFNVISERFQSNFSEYALMILI